MECFRRVFPLFGPLRTMVAGPIKSMGKHVFGDTNKDAIRSGNWYGNDTTWRMALDLNRMLLYSDRQGNIQDHPARRIFCIVDGIVGGEGNGPLDPTPKSAGVVLAGRSPVAVEFACARLMGFDYVHLPMLREALDRQHTLPLVGFDYDGIVCRSSAGEHDGALSQWQGNVLTFKPHFGWRRHVELANCEGQKEESPCVV